MFAGKPIIGILGGIGSGKTLVARAFAELGCIVIDSDRLAHQAYLEPAVGQTLRQWWGEGVINADGSANRSAIARKVFVDPAELRRLEGLIHPRVDALREELMQRHANESSVKAFVWDTPLLVETGTDRQCDALVFVDSPIEMRAKRVEKRGWDADELSRREKMQSPLAKKREIADYMISNAAGPDDLRAQVSQVLSRILSRSTPRSQ